MTYFFRLMMTGAAFDCLAITHPFQHPSTTLGLRREHQVNP
jgi:hypothetical protein